MKRRSLDSPPRLCLWLPLPSSCSTFFNGGLRESSQTIHEQCVTFSTRFILPFQSKNRQQQSNKRVGIRSIAQKPTQPGKGTVTTARGSHHGLAVASTTVRGGHHGWTVVATAPFAPLRSSYAAFCLSP